MDESIYGYGMPPNGSVHGVAVDQLINILHYFMAALFIGWGIFFIYCIVRGAKAEKATYEPLKGTFSKYLEIAVALFEAMLLLGLAMPVWAKLKNEFPKESEAVNIRVIAQQFSWTYHYPGADGKWGRTDVTLMDGVNSLGIDYTDPNAADDIVAGTMIIPRDKPVIARIFAKDVIHSFGVPVLRLKQDAIPGMEFPIHFEATREGIFEVVCSQLCGVGHFGMGSKVDVRSPGGYASWLVSNQAEAAEFGSEDVDYAADQAGAKKALDKAQLALRSAKTFMKDLETFTKEPDQIKEGRTALARAEKAVNAAAQAYASKYSAQQSEAAPEATEEH